MEPSATAPVTPAFIRTTISPEEMAEILRLAGYRAVVAEQEQAPSPWLQSAAHGLNFIVIFGNLLAGSTGRYQDLAYQCAITVGDTVPAAFIERWNAARRFGRLFRHQQSLVLAMDVLLAGGVSTESLRAHCELWDRLVQELALALQRPAAAETRAA